MFQDRTLVDEFHTKYLHGQAPQVDMITFWDHYCGKGQCLLSKSNFEAPSDPIFKEFHKLR